MQIDSLDHLVLTVKSTEATCNFYTRILGMQVLTFGDNRKALGFGRQKINLHLAGHEYEPKAHVALPGTADLCFLTQTPVDDLLPILEENGIALVDGPIARSGAMHKLRSVYFRDPDENLIEVANEVGPLPADPNSLN